MNRLKTRMVRGTELLLMSLMFAGSLTLTACEEGPGENAGEEIDDAVDDAADELN